MERAEIVNQVQRVVAGIVKHHNFQMRDDLTAKDVAGWDSLSNMAIVAELEKTFGITFKLKDLNKMTNMGRTIDLIQTKVSER